MSKNIIDKMKSYKDNKVLHGKDEYNNKYKNVTYTTIFSKDEERDNLFIEYIESFREEAKKSSRKYYIGIDYEFTTRTTGRETSLIQISFEYPYEEREMDAFIWIINPNKLSKEQKDNMVKYLFTTKYIYRIVHGADALDMPYTYDVLLEKDTEKIIRFTSRLIDTKLLCEYYKMSVGDNKICGIYQLLEYFGTITSEKVKELDEINDHMQPVQDIRWDINKLSSYHELYTLYDVLFLKRGMKDILEKAMKETRFYKSYKYVIGVIQFIYLEKREIITITKELKEKVDKMNTYFIRHSGNISSLVKIYGEIVKMLYLDEIDMKVENLLGVNYLKGNMAIIFKMVIYSIISFEKRIEMGKGRVYEGKMRINGLIEKLEEYKLHDIVDLVNLFHKYAKEKILVMYR